MYPDRFFPADLEPYPLHYAALRGQTQEVVELLATAECNPYEPIPNGETALHVALVEGQLEVAMVLIEQSRKDIELFGEYLIREYQLDPEDRFWTSRSILVAVSEEQCTSVKQWERSGGITPENVREGVLVLLKHPVGGESAAVLNPGMNGCVELFKLIKSIYWNGFLSWNSTGPSGCCETVLALAAYHGHAEVLEALINLGADLTFTNQHQRTPLHAACASSRHEIIELLLTKYIDRFDVLSLDEEQQHGLHYILYRKNKQSFLPALEAMINYRMNRFGDSKSMAFNSIFKLENKDWPNTSIWSQLNSAFWRDTLEKVCEEYEYDLSYQWAEVTILLDLINYKKLKKYCHSQIRQNHLLLKIASLNGFTTLHALICANELGLVKEMYKEDAVRTTEIFEVDAAFATLTSIMQQEYFEMLEFVLEKHKECFLENMDKIGEQSISECTAPNVGESFSILEKYLPQITCYTSPKRAELEEFSTAAREEFESIYSKLLEDFSSTVAEIKSSGKSLDDCNSSILGRCFLHQAIEDNHVELVEQLLAAGVDIDFVDVDQSHAIHHVRSIEMLQLLVRTHPDGSQLVHRKDREGFTLLHLLCTAHCVSEKRSFILELLKLGARIDERSNSQATVLHCTYEADLFEFLSQGLESEGYSCINVNLRDCDGNTALLLHLRNQQTEISSAMLRAAESYVSFNDSGESILAFLVRFDAGLFNNVFKSMLLENPSKTEEMFEAEWQRSKEQASQVFVEACVTSNDFCIEKMMNMDLDFNSCNFTGRTALLALLDRDDPLRDDFVECLLEKSVDLNLQTEDDRDALLMLGSRFHVISDVNYGTLVVKKMLDLGAQIDHVDQDGNSILHYAFIHVQLELIEVLLENGADLAITNSDGKLPYQVAPTDVSPMFQFLKQIV